MPSRSAMRWRQPSAWSRETSSSFRGVPSGFDVSNRARAGVHDVAHHLRQLADGQVLTGAHVDVLAAS